MAKQISIPYALGPLTCFLAQPEQAHSGTALIIHGRNGAARQPHIEALAGAYLYNGWSVAVPELPFSAATPDLGSAEGITFAAHCDAAQHILNWLQDAEKTAGPIALCGHSLGAFAGARLASEYSSIHHFLALSPVLSGQHLLDARTAMGPEATRALAREAPQMFETIQNESCAPALHRTTVPVAVMTGALDGLTPPHHARAFFDAAPNARFFCTLPGLHHCPAGPVVDRAMAAAFDALKV
ncbi:MAG: alpha/beta hydrolase [Roseobacter sp.]